jgi:hypothetical protein
MQLKCAEFLRPDGGDKWFMRGASFKAPATHAHCQYPYLPCSPPAAQPSRRVALVTFSAAHVAEPAGLDLLIHRPLNVWAKNAIAAFIDKRLPVPRVFAVPYPPCEASWVSLGIGIETEFVINGLVSIGPRGQCCFTFGVCV